MKVGGVNTAKTYVTNENSPEVLTGCYTSVHIKLFELTAAANEADRKRSMVISHARMCVAGCSHSCNGGCE